MCTVFLLALASQSIAQTDPQVDIEGDGTLLNIKQDLFTSNMVVLRATDTAGGATVNEGSDILTLRSAPTGFGQFIEMERGTVGAQLSGTTNINSGWDSTTQAYKINLNSVFYKTAEYTTTVTVNSPHVDKVWTTDDGSGNLIVQFLNDNTGPTQSDFHFIVYQK